MAYVNEEKRKFEKQTQMLEIYGSVEGEWESEFVVPGRVCLLSMKMTGKVVSKSVKIVSSDSRHENYMIFVFNDSVLVTKIVGSVSESQAQLAPSGLSASVGTGSATPSHKPYLIKAFIPVSECKITLIGDDERVQYSFDLCRSCPSSEEKSIRFQLFAENEKSYKEVSGCIKAIVNDYRKESMKKK